MRFPELKRKFSYSVSVSFFLFSFSPFLFVTLSGVEGFSQQAAAIFILKGNTKLQSTGKGMEGVEMELKKNGVVVSKINSGKNGKYYIQMDVSTTNAQNDYTLNISQEGTIPKLLSINTYISPEEFNLHTYARYDFDLEIVMVETNVKDIVLEKPSGKIHWDAALHGFAFDQSYAKIAQKEQDKMKDENYLKELAAKKKKEEDEAAKKKADEEAKLKADADAKTKADEEARKLAEQKQKEEAERILQQNMEAMKQEIMKKRIADSLAEIEKKKALDAANAKVEIQKFVKPVSPEDVDQNAFDGTGAYNINIAKKTLKARQAQMNKEKARNLSAKYETNNTLTSLLNVVDETDKQMKRQK
jgi:hypothetical protein